MSTADLTHEYIDAKGKPHTTLEIENPQGEKGGRIALNISKNRSADEHATTYKEFADLGKVLGFTSKVDPEGKLVIDTGTKSPEALVLLMSVEMENRKLIAPGEGSKGVEAVLQYYEAHGAEAIAEKENGQTQQNPQAMIAALEKSRTIPLASLGVQHTTQEEHNPASEKVALDKKVNIAQETTIRTV